jgi:hypothetical protein
MVFTHSKPCNMVLVMLFLTCFGGLAYLCRGKTPNDFVEVKATLWSGKASADDENHLDDLISSLLRQETDKKKRGEVESELIGFGRASSYHRQRLIQRLLESVKKQKELDGTTIVLGSTMPYWKSVTRVFAELRSSEALDVLIACIACGNGYSGSFNEQPSMDALIKLGDTAIPKLSAALLKERSPYKRIQLVLCLSNIGGPRATRALKRALRSETDKDVIWNIKNTLAR